MADDGAIKLDLMALDGDLEQGRQSSYEHVEWDYRTPTAQIVAGSSQAEFTVHTGEDFVELHSAVIQATLAITDSGGAAVAVGNTDFALASDVADGLFSRVSVSLNGVTIDDSDGTDHLYQAFVRRAITGGADDLRCSSQRTLVARGKDSIGYAAPELIGLAEFEADRIEAAGNLTTQAEARTWFEARFGVNAAGAGTTLRDVFNFAPVPPATERPLVQKWIRAINELINGAPGTAIPPIGTSPALEILSQLLDQTITFTLATSAPPTPAEITTGINNFTTQIVQAAVNAVLATRAVADAPDYDLGLAAPNGEAFPTPDVTKAALDAWVGPEVNAWDHLSNWWHRIFPILHSVSEEAHVGAGASALLAFTESGGTPNKAVGVLAKDATVFGEGGANTSMYATNGTARFRSSKCELAQAGSAGQPTLVTRPQHCVFQARGLLPSNVSAQVRFEFGNQQRLSVARAGAAWPLNVQITDMRLWFRRARLTQAMRTAQQAAILERPIRYATVRTITNSFPFDAGVEYTQNGLCSGLRPHLICAVVVPEAAYQGDRTLDPLAGGPNAFYTELKNPPVFAQATPISPIERATLKWNGAIVKPEIQQSAVMEQLPFMYELYQQACVAEDKPPLSYGMWRNYPVLVWALEPGRLGDYDADPVSQGSASISIRSGPPVAIPGGASWNTAQLRCVLVSMTSTSFSCDASRTFRKNWA